MKNQWRAAVCVLAATLVTCAFAGEQETASSPAATGGDDTVAVAAAWNEFQARFDAGDLDAMVAMFDEQALLLPVERPPVAGREAIRAFWSDELDGRELFGMQYDTELAEVVASGDWAYTRGSFTATGTTPNDDQGFRTKGRTLTVWRRQPDGAWKMYRAIANRSGRPVQLPTT